MKKCSKCLQEKPETEFYETGRTRKDGSRYRLPSCKDCYADYYERNKERQKATARRNNIAKRYGLTVDEYEALVAQGCSICGETEKRIVMDHCHVTNAVRAPLCDACNIMLGGARDNPALLRQAAVYIETHGSS